MYTTGTLTSTTPASDFVAYLGAQMLNVSWTQVSTNVVSGNNTWNVYKSPGTTNNIGNDFYAALGWDTSTKSYIGATVFEGWNVSTNTATNYPAAMAYYYTTGVDANNGGILLASYQSGNNTLPNSANFAASSGAVNEYGMSSISTSQLPTGAGGGVNYWVSATVDRVIFMVANVSYSQFGTAVYVGSFDPVQSLSLDPYPIAAINLSATGTGSGSDQQSGQVTGITTRANYFVSYGAEYCFSTYLDNSGSIVNTLASTTTDPYLGGKSILSKFWMTQSNYYWRRGVLKDIYLAYTTAYRGDILQWTLGGTTYNATCFSPGTSGGPLRYFAQV